MNEDEWSYKKPQSPPNRSIFDPPPIPKPVYPDWKDKAMTAAAWACTILGLIFLLKGCKVL